MKIWKIVSFMILTAFVKENGYIGPRLPQIFKSEAEAYSQNFLYVQAATKIVIPDHEDPFYTDVCYEITREMCDYCCLVDFEFCARDIGICEPVTDRHLNMILDCLYVFVGINCGFPVFIQICGCLITYRCCPGLYPATNGISCYEAIMRASCYCFCVRFDDTYKLDPDMSEEDQEKKGFKLFIHYVCCLFVYYWYKKRTAEPVPEEDVAPEGEEGDYEGLDGEEEGVD